LQQKLRSTILHNVKKLLFVEVISIMFKCCLSKREGRNQRAKGVGGGWSPLLALSQVKVKAGQGVIQFYFRKIFLH